MLDLRDVTSLALRPKEVLRVQLLSRSAPRITPEQLQARFFTSYSVGQISGALSWDLQLHSRPRNVRMQLCADFLREHPADPVSPHALRGHFGLTEGEVLSALKIRERTTEGGAPLSPFYPGSNWKRVEHELDVDLNLEGAYWHPLEVLHLHVIARRRLRPDGILDRRIFPGVALADIRHHLENVRVPSPETYRRPGGQLTPWARALIGKYLLYCQQARQFVTLAAAREVFGISANAMSGLSAEAGWSKAKYYEFRRQAYRELVERYTLRLGVADGVRPSDVLVCRHASKVWRFPAEMIRVNLAPSLNAETIRGLSSVPLPVAPLSGKGSAFEWYEKIPGRKLLYDVLSDHFGAIPRWELCQIFMLTENSFGEILKHEKIDPAEWDRANSKKKATLVFCLRNLTPDQSLDCIHTQILAQGGVEPAEASRLKLLDLPASTLREYRKRKTGLKRSTLLGAERASRELDPLTHAALKNYLVSFSAAVRQEQVMKYFGVDRTCLNKLRLRLASGDGPAYNHWGRTRRLKTARHFDGLARLLGLPVADAVSLLHIAVIEHATSAGLDTVLGALFPETTPSTREEIAAAFREFSNTLACPSAGELTALVRAYFRDHPGAPLHPVSEATGLTARRLEALLPQSASGVCIRRAAWSAQFAGTLDAAIWAQLRAHPQRRLTHRITKTFSSSAKAVALVVKRQAASAGLDSARYSGHS